MQQAQEQQRVPYSTFDLSLVDVKDRFSLWRESISVMVTPELPEKSERDSFAAKISIYRFSSVLFSHNMINKQCVNRDSSMIAKDDVNHFLIQLLTKGSFRGQWGGNNRSTVHPGDVLIVDLAHPLFASFDTDHESLTLVVPRTLLTSQFPDIEFLHGSVIRGNSIYGKLLGDHMTAAYQASAEMSLHEGDVVINGLVYLAGSYFSHMQSNEKIRAVSVTMMKSARSYILKNLNNPELSPENVAKSLRVSRAYLYRLFEAVGGVGRYIKEQRLKWAHQLLIDQSSGLRISDIAFNVGFNSASHFTRSFYQQYGFTPSDVRKAGPINLHLANPKNQSIDRSYEGWVSNLA